MVSLLNLGLSNLLVATFLAVLTLIIARFWRRPALLHALWLLVFIKLVTPPLLIIPVPSFDISQSPSIPQPEIQAVSDEPPALAAVKPNFEKPDIFDLPLDANLDVLPLLPQEEIIPAHEVPPVLLNAELPIQEIVGPNQVEKIEEKEFSPPIKSWPWMEILGIIWLAGAFVCLYAALRRAQKFSHLLGEAGGKSRELQDEADEMAIRLGLSKAPTVLVVPGVISPMLWAMGWSVYLIMPAELTQRLSRQQRATLLVHEMAHLLRRDHWVRYLECLVVALYWWCPLVWWFRWELHQVEEECCDAWVVWALPNSNRAYASALMDTLEFLSRAPSALPDAASGLGQISQLRRRLTMILGQTTARALSPLGLVAVCGFALLALPLLPGWSQDERPRPQPEQRRDQERQNRDRPRDDQPPRGKKDNQKKDRPRGEEQFRQEEQNERRAMMERIQAEMREVERNFDRQRREFEERMQDLQQRMRKLAGDRPGLPPIPGLPGMPGGMMPPGMGGRPGPDMERRLDQVQQQLERLMREIQELRGGMRPRVPRDREQPNVPRPPQPPREGERPRSPREGDRPEVPQPPQPPRIERPRPPREDDRPEAPRAPREDQREIELNIPIGR